MADNILIVDDEAEIADLIAVYLKNEAYTVYKFYTAKEALRCVETTALDLAILDVMLPDMSGFALCQKIREAHSYPVIMLTAKDAEMDKITGLTLGADDYITKPFRPLELVARVKSQLRRYKKYNPSQALTAEHILRCSDLTVDPKKHECRLGDTPVPLTPTEFSILQILLENKGTVVSGEELFHRIWKDEYYTGVLTLDTASIKVEAAGYKSSSRTVTATRSYDPTTEDDPVLTVTNRARPALRILKYDLTSNSPMPDVTFEVWHDGDLFGEYTTNASGEIFLYDLEPGTYLVKEIATDDAHVVNSTPQQIELKAGDTQTRELVFFNSLKPGIHLVKVDSMVCAASRPPAPSPPKAPLSLCPLECRRSRTRAVFIMV